MRNPLYLRTERNRPDVVYFLSVFGLLAVNDALAMWAFFITYCR